MLKRLWVLPILTILATAVVAAACGGGGGGGTATRTPGASPTATRPAASPTRPAATVIPGTTATAGAAASTPSAGVMQIDVTAQGTAFDKKTIKVNAGQPFTIILHNKDSMPHNLHIFTKKGGDSIAVTDPQTVEPGTTGTLNATIAQAGDYYFQCDFHPTQMTGTLTVK